jgi:hypothetical protein
VSEQPVPDDLRALLAAERERPDLDADRVASLFDRMSATLALPDAPSAPDAPGEPHAPPPPDPPAAAPDPGVALSLLQKYPVGSLLAALAIGASGGAAVTHVAESPRPTTTLVSTVASTVAPTLTAPVPAPLPQVSREMPPPGPSMSTAPSPMAAPTTPVSVRPDATGTRDADLAVERTLIERARSAMVRGSPQDALAATREHAQRFPGGRFAEERDFITIRALAASGDKARARAAADAFRLRHPQSLLLPAVDEVAP